MATIRQFGYQVSKDRQIDYDNNSRNLIRKVLEKEPSLNNCISCGTCAATCSAALYTDFSLRRLILLVRRGETESLKKETAKCMLCGKCQLVCPRGVSTRHLILQIRYQLQESGQKTEI
ncbi:MAG: 4Fe-4S dicluster domain-containing protein [Bacteroidales bacterium]|nr:4Fe-4S dicluster domain-containing protein [Bacteroidales bacterium]